MLLLDNLEEVHYFNAFYLKILRNLSNIMKIVAYLQ